MNFGLHALLSQAAAGVPVVPPVQGNMPIPQPPAPMPPQPQPQAVMNDPRGPRAPMTGFQQVPQGQTSPAVQQAIPDPRMDEIQGRLAVDSRADALMRKAALHGQTIPYALARAWASNDFPTTSLMTEGRPSLPGIDPSRLAATMGPAASQAAGQYQIGQGMNQNTSGRDQMQFDLAGRQLESGDSYRNNELALRYSQAALDDRFRNRQQDTNDRVAVAAIPNTAMQRQQAAQQFLQTPAAQAAANSTDPVQRGFYEQMTRDAMGQSASPGVTPPSGTNAPTTQGSPQYSQDYLIKQREAALAANPAAMQAHLSAFQDPVARAREQARIYAENGQGNNPAVGEYLRERLKTEGPNLVSNWPDRWAGQYGEGGAAKQSLIGMLLGIEPIAQRAAQHAEQNYGIPADVALPHYTSYYDRL